MNAHLDIQSNLANSLEIRVFSKLTPNLLFEVKKLLTTCKQLDGYETPFHWDCIENRKNPFTHEILCYSNQILIGYIALYYFKDKEVEITMLVHPNYRLSKVLRLMWEQIKLTVHRNKIETEYYTFTVHKKDENLIELLKDAEANRVNEIYKLALSKKVFQANKGQYSTIAPTFREATITDIEPLIELECQCFGTDANAYRENLESLFLDPKQKIFVVSVHEKVLGKIHYKVEKNEAFIFDFCVFIQEQNKGLGSSLLQQSLLTILEGNIKKILLETDTPHYLKWYKKLGFREIAIFEHWKLYYPSFIKYHDHQYRMLALNHYQEYDLLA